MTKQDVEKFEKNYTQLDGMHLEIGSLSDKSPNADLNKIKVDFLNKILNEANELLGENYIPFKDFTIFKPHVILSNSDVTMMLTQYINCMELLRINNIMREPSMPLNWYWLIDGKLSDKSTIAPKMHI